MVSIPTRFLNKVDRVARSQGRSRSGLIPEALSVTLGERSARISWKQAIAPLRKLEAQWIGEWDSTDIVRFNRGRCYGSKDRR